MILGVVVLVMGCKQPSHAVSRSAYIVGPSNDIVSLDQSNSTNVAPQIWRASVLLVTTLSSGDAKFCSGVLIDSVKTGGPLRVLTNHHCFATLDGEGNASVGLLPEACVRTKVYFGFTKENLTAVSHSTCSPGTLRTNYDGDVAVFTLASTPSGYSPLVLSTAKDGSPGRKALIVHYPDVAANQVTIAGEKVKLPTAALTTKDCSVQGKFAISEWHLDRALPYSLRHTCDLVHGSSGSALVDAENGQILGINWGGIMIRNTDGSVDTVNAASSAEYVTAFLAGETDKLKEHVQETMKSADARVEGEKENESKGPLPESVRRVFCSVVGGADTDFASNRFWAWTLWIIPLFFAVWRRRRRTGV